MIAFYYSTQPIELKAEATVIACSEDIDPTVPTGEWNPNAKYDLGDKTYSVVVTCSEKDMVWVVDGALRATRHKKGTSVPKPPYIERLHPRKDTHKTPYWHRIRSNPFRRNYH